MFFWQKSQRSSEGLHVAKKKLVYTMVFDAKIRFSKEEKTDNVTIPYFPGSGNVQQGVAWFCRFISKTCQNTDVDPEQSVRW